jgi:hypothetical protein
MKNDGRFIFNNWKIDGLKLLQKLNFGSHVNQSIKKLLQSPMNLTQLIGYCIIYAEGRNLNPSHPTYSL